MIFCRLFRHFAAADAAYGFRLLRLPPRLIFERRHYAFAFAAIIFTPLISPLSRFTPTPPLLRCHATFATMAIRCHMPPPLI